VVICSKNASAPDAVISANSTPLKKFIFFNGVSPLLFDMALFVEHISTLSADITSVLKSKVTEWIASQAGFIQALLGSICWES